MKRIPLHRHDGSIGAHALVDDVDFERFGQFRWSLTPTRYGDAYAHRKTGPRKAQVTHLLHREVMGLGYGDPEQVDHKNGDKLDCRRSNLRIATPQVNAHNRQKPGKANTSGYTGVSWHKQVGKWRAYVTISRKQHHLGLFTDPVEAAAAVERYRTAHGLGKPRGD